MLIPENIIKLDPRGNNLRGKPARTRLDIAGLRSRMVVAIKFHGLDSRNAALWECICDCGNLCYRHASMIKRCLVHSCGCHLHGLSRTKVYNAWSQAFHRTTNPKFHNYKIYGGRGITMCQRWRDPRNFVADMGHPSKGLTLERINNEGHYSCGKCEQCLANGWPMNCKWDTPLNQANNRRTNRTITAFGKTQTMAQWSRETGIPKSTIKNRVYSGKMAAEQIVTR